MTTKSVIRPIEIMPGVQPLTDAPALGSRHWRHSKSVRSVNGQPKKIGGTQKITFYEDAQVEGVVRSLYSAELSGRDHLMIGSNAKLYDAFGNRPKDITPDGLATGDVNEKSLMGYGAGLYGMDLYGTTLVSEYARSLPRIWFMDRFGDSIIAAPGENSDVYYYTEDMDKAEKVPNSPIGNYAFVSNNCLIILGAEGIPNRIVGSDQNDITNYVSSSTNQVFRDDIEGAGRLLSHVSAKSTNLIFSSNKTYSFRKISLASGVWEILPVDSNIGIIAPMARCSAKGIAVWMSENNFCMWRGVGVEMIPSNNKDVPQSTCLRYVFDDLNYSQKSKIFAWYNPLFDEIQFHYPSASSNECNRIARINLADFSWWIDEQDRTAAEYPSIGAIYPRVSDLSSNIYYQEIGNDNDIEPLDFSLTSPLMTTGKSTATLESVIPDSIQSGDLNLRIRARLWPRSTVQTFSNNYTITAATETVQTLISGRYWDYTISGNALDQQWHMGAWQEEIKEASMK